MIHVCQLCGVGYQSKEDLTRHVELAGMHEALITMVVENQDTVEDPLRETLTGVRSMGRQKVDMGALRTDTALRAGGVCEWAECLERGEEMAHLEAKGMGGNPDQSRNTLTNTVWLCRYHHDVLDRRITHTTKFEMRTLLAGFVRLDRKPRGRG